MDHILLRTTKDYRSWVVVWRLPHDPPWIVQFYSAKPSACVRRISPRWRRALVGACALLATGRPDEALQPGPATGDLRAVREGFAWLLTVHRAAWEGPAEPRLEAMRPLHPAVAQAVRLLRDGQGRPTLPELAARTGLSPGRLGRLFRVECGSGVVEWRNRLRLDRWLELTAAGAGAFDAAMDAGFGSYAQFHRVHRARFGRGPRSVAKG
jgi:AraC-like DNA-binding protein